MPMTNAAKERQEKPMPAPSSEPSAKTPIAKEVDNEPLAKAGLIKMRINPDGSLDLKIRKGSVLDPGQVVDDEVRLVAVRDLLKLRDRFADPKPDFLDTMDEIAKELDDEGVTVDPAKWLASVRDPEVDTRNELELLRRWAAGLGLHVPTSEDLFETFGDQAPEVVAEELAKTERPDGPKPSTDLIRLQVARQKLHKVDDLLEVAEEMQRRSEVPGQADVGDLRKRVWLLSIQVQPEIYASANVLNLVGSETREGREDRIDEALSAITPNDDEVFTLTPDQVGAILGRTHTGNLEDDVVIIEALLNRGKAPRWLSSSQTMVDELGWHARPAPR